MKRVDTIARVRRAFYVQGWSVKKIVRELHVSRNPAQAPWLPPKPPEPTCRASKARSPNQTQPDAVSDHW